MLTCLVIGDPHFKVSNILDTDRMTEAILKVAHERQPTFIVVLGDTLDRHESIHVSPLKRATMFLHELSLISPTYLLIGNHDLKNNQQFLSNEHPFTAFKYWGPRLTVVDTTTIVSINDNVFTFVPYVPPGRFEEALNTIENWQHSTAIFGHQEFKGVKMGPIVSVEGDDWPLSYPYVITGHIHNYDEPQANIVSVGAPIQHAFGDTHDKTISYFTFTNNEQGSFRSHERIDLRLPKKLIIRLSAHDVPTYVPPTNTQLKICISGTAGELKAIMNHPNINKWKNIDHHKISKKILPLESDNSSMFLQNSGNGKYSEILYSMILNNQLLTQCYHDIFG